MWIITLFSCTLCPSAPDWADLYFVTVLVFRAMDVCSVHTRWILLFRYVIHSKQCVDTFNP